MMPETFGDGEGGEEGGGFEDDLWFVSKPKKGNGDEEKSGLTHESEQTWSSHHNFFLVRSFHTILTISATAARPVSVQVMARISDPRFSDSIFLYLYFSKK